MPFDGAAVADVLETVIRTALAPLSARLKAIEARIPAEDTIGALRERVASLEARPALPGPPGMDGAPGTAGADGLGFDSYAVVYDGERTFTHTWTAGEKAAAVPFKVPLAIYRGVFVEGRIYERGDLVTIAGSVYHCNSDTTGRPGTGSKDWTLAVKSGQTVHARSDRGR